MQSFAVTGEQQLLSENLRRLLSATNAFEARRHRLSKAPPDRLALWPALADLGVLGAAFEEVHGGFAGDARTIAVIMMELGAALAVEPYLATAVIAGRVLRHWTDEPARRQALDALIAGQDICVLAHAPGDDPFAVPRLQARRVNDAMLLSGTVQCVRHADVAHRFLVPATAEDGSICILRIAADSPGLARQPYRLIDAAGAADLVFDNARIAPQASLGFDVPASVALREAIEWGILGLAAETAGIVGALNAATFSYLTTRKQFGAVLGSFQALQHRAADMLIAAEEILAITDLAIESLQTSVSSSRSATLSAAKVVADVAGRRVGHEAVQLHGGMGVSDELSVSHYARRLVAIRAELGSAEVHRQRFGKLQ
jgi:alkylation response protein AidB-like acyl-CoA dehydrogenase